MLRNRTRLLALSTLALTLVPALVACGTSGGGGATSTAKKICLVTDIGGLNDRGFNALANTGPGEGQNGLQSYWHGYASPRAATTMCQT